MLYVSTRGGVRGVSFVQALLSGCSPDGGLYVPQTIPKLRQEEWKELAALNYEELSKKLFRLFVSRDEIPDADYNGWQIVYDVTSLLVACLVHNNYSDQIQIIFCKELSMYAKINDRLQFTSTHN